MSEQISGIATFHRCVLALALGASIGYCADAAAEPESLQAAPEVIAEAPAEATPGEPELATIAVDPQPAEESPLPQETPSALQLEEVIVTSTKREESVRNIPASITAMQGEELEKRGAQGVEDIVRTVPGVNFTSDPTNASRVTIRGISADVLSNPTTGVLFGDVSFTDSYLPRVTLDPNPFDLKTVEVLKGPQGTLFGAAALNGAIRYVPEPPVFGAFEARYFAQYSWITHGGSAPVYGAAVNLPFGSDDQFALRLVAFDRESPGYIDDLPSGRKDVNRVDQHGVRGILGWRPGENWNITLTYANQQTRIPDVGLTDNVDGDLSRSFLPRPSPANNEYDFVDLNLRYQFDWAEFVSESAYANKAAHKFLDVSRLFTSAVPALSNVPLVDQLDDSESDSYSQEFRLVSANDPDARWRWVVGAFGSSQDIQFVPTYRLVTPSMPLPQLTPLLDAVVPGLGGLLAETGQVNLLTVDTDVQVKEYALFGELTRRLGEHVEASLGGRLYRTLSGGRVVQTGVFIATTGQLEQIIDGEVKEQGFNPKASLLWHVTDDILLYTAASRGFRVGGVQPGFTSPLSAKQAPDFFKSDVLWNYEIGTRTQWFDNTLRADATVFQVDWDDPQIFENDSTVGLPYIDNVGGVRSRGIETSLQWLTPLRGLLLTNSAAFTRTETTKPFTTGRGVEIAPGGEWPFAPRWQTATTLSYTADVAQWTLSGAVTHTYTSKSYAQLEKEVAVFDYQQWDLQFGLSNATVSWLPDLTLNVNNLGDERAVSNGVLGGLVVPSYVEAVYVQPRTVTLRLSGRF